MLELLYSVLIGSLVFAGLGLLKAARKSAHRTTDYLKATGFLFLAGAVASLVSLAKTTVVVPEPLGLILTLITTLPIIAGVMWVNYLVIRNSLD